jgi:hypothetical protein
VKDPRIEQILNREGVTYTYIAKVPLDQIDEKQSLKNQARHDEPLDADYVATYAIHMLDGYEFPALVAYMSERTAKYVLCDGNHRYAGKKEANITTTDLYQVFSNDAWVIYRLTHSLNTIEGRREAPQAAMAHAVDACIRFPADATRKDMAKRYGVSETTLRDEIEYRVGYDRVMSVGYDPVKIGRVNLRRLVSIHSDVVLGALTALIRDGALGTTEVSSICTSVNRLKSEKRQLDYIEAYRAREEYRDRTAKTARGTTVRRNATPPGMQLMRSLQASVTVLERSPSHAALGITSLADRARLLDLEKDLFAKLARARVLG